MPTFHQHARKVVNASVPISVRHTELIFCLSKLAALTYAGSVKDGDYTTFCRVQRGHLNRRFGFDDTVPPNPEQLIAALAFAYAEYHRLRHIEQIIYRRRVAQKMFGRRFATPQERNRANNLWQQAVARFLDNLGQ